MSIFMAISRRCVPVIFVLFLALTPAAVGAASAPPLPGGCPSDPVTLDTLVGLRLDGGPLSRTYAVQTNEQALACFGSNELTFVAFDAAPEGLGGVVAYTVAPAWLDTWNSVPQYLAASDREAAPGAPFGPFLPVALPPELQASFDGLRGQWVAVSGQFGAPAASSCVVSDHEAATGVPTPIDLAELCRTSFVVTSIEPVADPCPADDSLPAILTTPEQLRADCFGGRELSFEAVGWSINNVWPGLHVAAEWLGGDWDFAMQGEADPDSRLTVFVPATLPLPDPAGTPWRDRDGVGGPDVRWRVSGHFDDPLADACIPAEGDTMDGAPVVLSIGDVRAFCRNHFVVDALTWLPGEVAAPSPAAETPSTQTDAPAATRARSDATILLLVVFGVAALIFLVAVLVARRRA